MFGWSRCPAGNRETGAVHTWAMTTRPHNPSDVFPPYANYAHAVEVAAGARMLFVSGLNGAFNIADAATPNVLREGKPLHTGLFYVSYTTSYDDTSADTVHR